MEAAEKKWIYSRIGALHGPVRIHTRALVPLIHEMPDRADSVIVPSVPLFFSFLLECSSFSSTIILVVNWAIGYVNPLEKSMNVPGVDERLCSLCEILRTKL